MADDTPFANGAAGPAPRPCRKMYASPFGALSNDSPPIQYGDEQTGPTQGINTLASSPPPQPIAQPFGMLPTAGFTSQPPPPATLPAPAPAPAPQPIAAPCGALLSAPMPPIPTDFINALMRALRRY